MTQSNRGSFCRNGQVCNVHPSLTCTHDDDMSVGTELLSCLQLRRMKYKWNSFKSRNVRYVGSDVDTGTYGHSIALPNCCSDVGEILYHKHMSRVTSLSLYEFDFRAATNQGLKLKLIDISLEILNILLWSDKIRSVAG